jgi:hypothetical protein
MSVPFMLPLAFFFFTGTWFLSIVSTSEVGILGRGVRRGRGGGNTGGGVFVCTTVSHDKGGISRIGMKDGLRRMLCWTSLPSGELGANGIVFWSMLVVFSLFASCGCEFGNGAFVVSNPDMLLLVVSE